MEAFQSAFFIIVHLLYRVFDATRFSHSVDHPLHLLLILVVVLQDVNDLSPRFTVRFVEHIDKWQRKFLFLDVVARWFTDVLTCVIEKVVLYLESHAGFFPELAHFFGGSFVIRRGPGAGSTGRGEQRSGPVAYNRVLDLFV